MFDLLMNALPSPVIIELKLGKEKIFSCQNWPIPGTRSTLIYIANANIFDVFFP